MKKIILTVIIFIGLFSCRNSATDSATNVDSLNRIRVDTTKLAYPVRYVDWELGDFNNVVTITNLYKMWDGKEATDIASYFADTVRLRLPEERSEIVIPNSQISKRLGQNRNMYGYTSNEMVSAVSLRDKPTGEEWVMITTFSKWTEKNGRRDSILYHDDWRIKNGKVDFLMSYSKMPTAEFLKNQAARK
jgi:hypothetical protein